MNVTHHRLAVAVWGGRISPLFDVARQLLVLDVREGRPSGRVEVALPGGDLCAQADRLASTRATTLVCGAISRPLASMLVARGIHVLGFTAGDVEQVIAAYLADALPADALLMPGCCRHRHGGGDRRCRRIGNQ